MNKALRYNKNKLRWSLVDFDSLQPLVQVLEFGCQKYAKDNWKLGLDRTEILESLQRHLVELFKKEELDEESKLKHIGHIMANAMFYSYFQLKEEKDKVNEG